MKKKCFKCEEIKNIEEFSFRNKIDKTRNNTCKKCHKKYVKKHYDDNKKKYIEKSRKNSPLYAKRNKSRMKEYLSDKRCCDCGEDDPVVLQFDHVSGNKKKCVSVMVMGCYSWETILKEISKCEIRCSNCHIRRHYKKRNGPVME